MKKKIIAIAAVLGIAAAAIFICRVSHVCFCIASVQSYIITKTDKTGQ